MKSLKSISISIFLPMLVFGMCVTGIAQQTAVPASPGFAHSSPEQDVFFYKQVGSGGIALPPVAGARVFDQMVTFISAADAGGDRTVTGAPYSADAVTETVQMLADGNRITKKISSRIARDRDGRTRRDQNLGAIGPWVATDSTPQVSFIMDPVAKTQLILEHETRTARQMPAPNFGTAAFRAARVAGPKAVGTFEMPVGPEVAGVVAQRMVIGPRESEYETRTESLGKQFIEGVEAEGARMVTTIPAGAIGNERPIDMISETWFAPSLQLMVLSRNSDPRFGETTYRLENLSLIDPLPSLFEVPRDYTIAGPPGGGPASQEIRKPVIPGR